MSALLVETTVSHEEIIELVARKIADEPRGVLFKINEYHGSYSLHIDHIKDGERDSLLPETEPVHSRESVIVSVIKIIHKAMAIQHSSGQRAPEICVTDVSRVTERLERGQEAQLKFYR